MELNNSYSCYNSNNDFTVLNPMQKAAANNEK